MLAAGEALPAEKTESEWVFSDEDGNSVGQVVLLYSWSALVLRKRGDLESPASFIATIFTEK